MGAAREYHEQIGSTQSRALELARAGATEGTRVVAAQQTEGRGRAAHRWESAPGGLYVSVVLEGDERAGSLLPLGIGVQLAHGLEQRFGVAARLKWPNDLYVPGLLGEPRKMAGILVDAIAAGPRLASVAGIGVNVRRPAGGFPGGLRPGPIALDEIVSPAPEIGEVEEIAVEAALAAARELRRSGGARTTVARCQDLLYGVGRPAWVDGVRIGTIGSLEPDGALRVDRPGGPMTIRAGDLRVGEP